MATEILASLDDINVHLPDDKAKMQDSDDDELQTDIARYIRALFSGFYSTAIISGWNSPSNTPELIRGIAGRLIAAKWYARLYSEDVDGVSAYAQYLYNEANRTIDQLRTGMLTLVDGLGVEIVNEGNIFMDSDDFFPNDSAGPPKFSMDMTFG